jgi:hypothetical protein
MRKQLELFDSPFIKFHKDTEEMSRRTAKALDDNFGDLISIINDDIDTALESGDNDRLVELVQMRTAYQQ